MKRRGCDLLVIGGGIAGCLAAIRGREVGLDVTLASKGTAGRSGSSIVAAGIYLGYEEGEDLDAWVEDAFLHRPRGLSSQPAWRALHGEIQL